MQIKRFEARDMTEALKMVKTEFGPEAVILSARNLEKGRGILGILKRGGVEVTAAMDPASAAKAESQAEAVNAGAPVNGKSVSPPPAPRPRYAKSNMPSPVARRAGRWLPGGNMNRLAELHQILIDQQVNESVAWNLIGEMSQCTPEPCILAHQVRGYLIQALQNKGIQTAPFQVDTNRQRIIALVGPAGVGKTTTAAKLAILHGMSRGRRVGLLALDDERIGGGEQLRVYARIIGIPFEATRENEPINGAMARFKDRDLVFLDTEGIGCRDNGRLLRIKERIAQLPNVENHLLLSASMKEQDMSDIIDHFSNLPLHGLIFTKLDESGAYGTIINQLLHYRIPVSYLTNGQQVPEDIIPASIEALVEMIMHPGRASVAHTVRPTPAAQIDIAKPAEEPARVQYIANRNSDVFHHPQCRWATKIKERNVIHFRDKEEAIQMNYKPCKMCLTEDGELAERTPADLPGLVGLTG